LAEFSEIPWIAEHIEFDQTDPEEAHMWDPMAKFDPSYTEYQERAGNRTIPVALLDPVA
jgi:hypothetical protein